MRLMTVIRLYTKVVNPSDFAFKLIHSLMLKGYKLNVICDKIATDKFVSKKINTENIHFSDLVESCNLQFFNYDILLNLSLKFIPQFSSFSNFIEIFNSNETKILNERISYFNLRGYPLKIFQNNN